ncbi:MAG: hypothetical protein KAT70_00690, partial [Thermoplasmata archaeon]|nr:hypothetical protein [Thermoplasmata archaeon]
MEVATPITKTPVLLIDHADNATKIYVIGIEDTRYNNITINITGVNSTEVDPYWNSTVTNTFVWSATLSNATTNFTLSTEVWYRGYSYALNATVE